MLKNVTDNNYWYYIFCYVFIDGNNILPTAFELMAFVLNITICSHAFACKRIIEIHIKEVIDPQIGKVQLELAKEYCRVKKPSPAAPSENGPVDPNQTAAAAGDPSAAEPILPNKTL